MKPSDSKSRKYIKNAGTKLMVLSLFVIMIGISVYAGELEEFEVARNLYDAKKFDEAQGAFVEFQNKYPGSPIKGTSLAFDIKCDYKLKKWDQFNQRLSNFRESYPDHELMHELDYLKGWVLRKQQKWDESREFFKEYIKQYPNSPYRKNAEEIAGPSQLMLARALDAYWNKDYENARILLADFVTSYPLHTRAEELLYRRAECLFRMSKYEEYLEESQDLLLGKPKRSHAEDLVYLQGVALARLKRGPEARVKVENFETKFPGSTLAPEVKQLRFESYFKYENYENIKEQDKDNARGFLCQYLQECRKEKYLYEANLPFVCNYYYKHETLAKWLVFLNQEKQIAGTENAEIIPCIDYFILRCYWEEAKFQKIVDQAQIITANLPETNEYKKRISTLYERALGELNK